MTAAVQRVRVLRTGELQRDLLPRLRRLMDDAFGGEFSDADWEHALGGWHVVVLRGELLLGHAAVVPRELHVGDSAMAAGYVEAVAVDPQQQGAGLGTLAMRAADQVLRRDFQMGALSTGEHRFYERLGWERWRGPTYVRHPEQTVRTPDEDDGIMVLPFGASAQVDVTMPLSCAARPGDDW